jgi:tRNA pseudouridine55 synthase
MLTGILLLDKPLGLSSNSALQRVKRLLRAEKAGHVGSLDPLATGMLPICLGEATKIAGDILSGRKRYLFTAALGDRTATGDLEGAIVETLPVPAFDRAALDGVLSRFLGKQMQVPPMYSAIKRDGQPLYKLARRGVSVERAARPIEIYALELLEMGELMVRLRVECSKGTYVRTLAEQFGELLGSCAHVSALRRDFVEPFRGEPMHTLDELQGDPHAAILLPADRAVTHLPQLHLSAAQARALRFGQTISAAVARAGPLRLYDPAGRFLGLGVAAADGAVRPQRLFTEYAGATP